MDLPNDQLLDHLLDAALDAANEELRSRHRSISVQIFSPRLARRFVENRDLYIGEPTMAFQVFSRMQKARQIGITLAREIAPN